MSDTENQSSVDEEVMAMTAEIVAAYVGNNSLPVSAVPELVQTVHHALSGLGKNEPEQPAEPLKPAVSIRRSITPDYLVCLEDGKKLKMLKRHLRTTYGMTPEEYRAKWGLPSDYPMVAPNYAKQRSEFAKKIGLGRSTGSKGRKRR